MKKQRSKEANQQLQLANRWKGQGCLGSLRLAQKKKIYFGKKPDGPPTINTFLG